MYLCVNIIYTYIHIYTFLCAQHLLCLHFALAKCYGIYSNETLLKYLWLGRANHIHTFLHSNTHLSICTLYIHTHISFVDSFACCLVADEKTFSHYITFEYIHYRPVYYNAPSNSSRAASYVAALARSQKKERARQCNTIQQRVKLLNEIFSTLWVLKLSGHWLYEIWFDCLLGRLRI